MCARAARRFLNQSKNSQSWIGQLFKNKFVNCNNIYTCLDLEDNYKVTVTYKKAYSGCKRRIELIRGFPDQSYQHLVGCSHMLRKRNPETVTAIKTAENDAFMYYFMDVGVCLDGFKRKLRPAFAVDGTNLTSNAKESTVSPAAFGDTFSRRKDLVIGLGRSNKIREAIENAFPAASHVYSAYHIIVSLAQAYTVSEYAKAMKDVEKLSRVAADDVRDTGTMKWVRVHAKGVCYSLMTTNVCESWNAKLLEVKDLPICHLVDYIRKMLMLVDNKLKIGLNRSVNTSMIL
ncbi:hypothetical protein MKX01_039704 [Papaver californicum]|nr:hypothetical protein MKX01_039704 [Papaver californicum]